MRHLRRYPSLLLTDGEVATILVELNAEAGARGGAAGARVTGSQAAVLSGRTGGRVGGRLGARLFTRVDGDGTTWEEPADPERLRRIHYSMLRDVLDPRRVDGATEYVGIMGSGFFGMNRALVQLRWGDRLELSVHGLEGLVRQRTVDRALARILEILRT